MEPSETPKTNEQSTPRAAASFVASGIGRIASTVVWAIQVPGNVIDWLTELDQDDTKEK